MARKLILLLVVLMLILSACLPAETPTAESPAATTAPTEEVEAPEPEPTAKPAEPTPVEEAVPDPTEEPAPYPYPEPEVEAPAAAAASDPYPGPEQVQSWPHSFVDDLDRSVELAGPAQRIVTLGPSSLESLFAVGAGAQIVGREEYSTYPEEALEITSVGSLWGELPTEAILALEPDLVIAPEIISPEQVQALEELGLTVYFQANPVDFPGLWKNLQVLAALTGHESEAETLIAELDGRVKAVEEKIAPLSARYSVFYELDATDPQNPYTIGAGTFIDTIITMSGGVNIGQALEGAYAPISSEEVITQNPDIILLADAPYGVTPDAVAARAGWDVIVAVQNGAVYEFDPFLVSVPGPRLVDGLEAMARLIHPGVFE